MAITAKDMQFHRSPSGDPLWAETNYFPFHIESEGIQAAAYILTRPSLGVALIDVTAYQGFNHGPETLLYYDKHAHLPLPERLEEYTLANGFSVKAINAPMEYEVDYVGYDDTEFHLHYKGLAAPYDMNDPEQDPITAKLRKESENSWGKSAYTGHFDQTLHVTGEAKLLGKPYKIDCVTTMDHSWGPRPEMGLPNMSWFHGHWGKDLAIHCISYFDPANTKKIGPLLHGYVIQDGVLYGLTEGSGVAERDGFLPMQIDMQVKDTRGKAFHFTGRALATYPWMAWPGNNNFSAFLKWDYEGRTGWGEAQDCLNMRYVTQANRGRHAPAAALASA
ncbi:MAG: DUF7064 domain-containing protein [Alphaproteobacteria bacterium]